MIDPKHFRIFSLIACLLCSAVSAHAQSTIPRGKERLIPGNFGEKQDGRGNRWSVQQHGVVKSGSNSMFNTCGQLLVNGVAFYSGSNPMVTPDGKEWVMEHTNQQQQFGGLKVKRRIRLMENEGCLRFLEVFENPTQQSIAVSAEIRNQFGTQYKNYLTDALRQNVTGFEKNESGMIVTPGTSNNSSYKPVLLTACSPGAHFKPRISAHNQYAVYYHYQITVPPGQKTVIMHSISQCPKQGTLSAKGIENLLKSSTLQNLYKSVPRALRGRIANYSTSGAFGSLSLLSSTTVDGLGIGRAKSDVVAYGENSRIFGTASCGELKLGTGYGEATIPFEQVAAVVGENNGLRSVSRVFLRDGQVYTGKAAVSDLRVVMTDGSKMSLKIENLDRLVRSEVAGEGKWDEGVTAMLETYAGDRIAISNGAELQLDAVTPWGQIQFSLDDILWLSPPDDGGVGHRIEFKDGSRLLAYLNRATLKVNSELFGELELDSGQLRAVVTGGMMAKIREREKGRGFLFGGEETLLLPHVNLAGGQRIIGRIAAPTIGAITNANLIEIAPQNIRLMQNMKKEAGSSLGEPTPFSVDLWGGSVIIGQIKERILPVNVRGQTWNIPLGDIVEVVSPVPRISDETRQQITALIRDLGAAEWVTRDAAMDPLREFGYLARGLMLDALRISSDPEATRRLEALLNEIQ